MKNIIEILNNRMMKTCIYKDDEILKINSNVKNSK